MSVNTLAVGAVSNIIAADAIAANVPPPPPPPLNDSLAALTKYIPTESITLYIATVSAQKAIITYLPWLTSGLAYKIFLVITPVLMIVLFLRKLALANENWKISPLQWPWWRIVASTIAFAVWALAVPGNPVISADSATGGVAAGIAALFVSTLLNLFEPFFERPKA